MCRAARVAAPRTTWFFASIPWPERMGGLRAAWAAVDERRNGLAVDLHVCVVESGPCGDVWIVVEKVADHGRDGVTALGFDGEVPVPPVQRGMRIEGASPLAKVSVATTTVTASTAPTSTERTGTADRP